MIGSGKADSEMRVTSAPACASSCAATAASFAFSDPVRSEYGYHLIQVLGRRDAEGSISQQMDLARQAIGQRKAEQAYADWLRELRDTAYVEVKPTTASVCPAKA